MRYYFKKYLLLNVTPVYGLKWFQNNQNSRLIHSTRIKLSHKDPPKPTITMSEVDIALQKWMGVEKQYKEDLKSREYLNEYLPKSQAELEPRSMQDSFTSAIVPLSTDSVLQDRYVTFLGHLRLGRLLENMDMFAVWIAKHHIKNPLMKPGVPSPYNIVTATVDKIEFTDVVPSANQDIRLSGHVSWAGTSSLETVVWLEQMQNNKWQKITRALFVMVARNSTNTGPAFINAIKPGNVEEEKIYSGGLDRKNARLSKKTQSLRKVIPTPEEQQIIHHVFLKTVPENEVSINKIFLPPNCLWMEDYTVSNVIFAQPLHRNMHNTIFGGFIMRLALELSWILAFKFTKTPARLRQITDIQFLKPVVVNSLIRMKAYVVYTNIYYVQISVFGETLNPTTGAIHTTNEYNFTYMVDKQLPEILPKSYIECIMYLDGRRHFNELSQNTIPVK